MTEEERLKELKEQIELLGEFDHEDHPFNTNPNKDTRWYFTLRIPQDDWNSMWE